MNYIFIDNTTGHRLNILNHHVYPRQRFTFLARIHGVYHIKHGSKVVARFEINKNGQVHHLHARGVVKKSCIITYNNDVSKRGNKIKLLEFGKAYGYGNEEEYPLFLQ